MAKGGRELLKLVNDVSKLLTKGQKAFHRERARKAARSLSDMAFPVSGALVYLQALQRGGPRHAAQLALQEAIDAEHRELNGALAYLRGYVGHVRERFGLEAAETLEIIACDKAQVRAALSQLLGELAGGRQLAELQSSVAGATDAVWRLNRLVGQLHDELVGAAAARKAGRTRA